MGFIEVEIRDQKDNFNMSDFQSHDFFELYFLLSGTREVFIENKLFQLPRNSFCIIPPYFIHKTEGAAYKRINLYVSESLLTETEKATLETLSKTLAFSLSNEQAQFLSVLLSQAAELNVSDIKIKTQHLLAFTKTTLSYLSTQPLTPLSPVGSTITHTYTNTTILQIVGYINENYQSEITLDDLSQKFFISKNTLCKRFRQAMNCSVMQYVIYVRLNKAKMYLSSTTKSMETVADLCGFPSANYFSLIFKQRFGISPLNYRKKQ